MNLNKHKGKLIAVKCGDEVGYVGFLEKVLDDAIIISNKEAKTMIYLDSIISISWDFKVDDKGMLVR